MRSGKKALTDSEVRALTPGPRRVVHSLGNSLLLVVEGVKNGGSKRFVGRYRFPPGRGGKQKELALGTYGKGARTHPQTSEGPLGERACLDVGAQARTPTTEEEGAPATAEP